MATLFDAKGNRLMASVEVFEPFNLVVMCFNVQFWNGLNGDMNLIKTIVDTYKPDIIAFQEYQEWPGGNYIFSSVLTEYPHHYIAENPASGLGFASKYALEGAITKPYTVQGQETRAYIKAYMNFNHQRVCLLNAHLEIMGDNHSEIRRTQAAELLEVMKAERYAICTGDFNVADCHNNKSAEYIANIKPFIDEGYHSANSSDQHGFLATYYSGSTVDDYDRCECIDEIITTSNIDINMVTVDKQKSDANTSGLALDHLPIVAYCRVNG